MSDANGERVFVLHGVADRDPDELVCMFFNDKADLDEFVEILPGHYAMLTVTGIDYDAIEVDHSGDGKP
jgi:hypothetical protein